MKAMLYADWMNFRQMMKSILFIAIVFLGTALIFEKAFFMSMTVVMLSIMTPITLCASDKAYGWDRLSMSLPIMRRDMVGSKFLLSLLTSGVLLLAVCALSVVYRIVYPGGVLLEDIAVLLFSEAVALVLMGIVLAVAVKWGIEKARYVMMACVWVPMIALFIVSKFVSKFNYRMPDLSGLQNLEPYQVLLTSVGTVAAALLVYFLCYVVARKSYEKIEL